MLRQNSAAPFIVRDPLIPEIIGWTLTLIGVFQSSFVIFQAYYFIE
jgi:hypothetical protein